MTTQPVIKSRTRVPCGALIKLAGQTNGASKRMRIEGGGRHRSCSLYAVAGAAEAVVSSTSVTAAVAIRASDLGLRRCCYCSCRRIHAASSNSTTAEICCLETKRSSKSSSTFLASPLPSSSTGYLCQAHTPPPSPALLLVLLPAVVPRVAALRSRRRLARSCVSAVATAACARCC